MQNSEDVKMKNANFLILKRFVAIKYDEDGELNTRCFFQLLYSSFQTSSNTDYNDYTCLIQTKFNPQPIIS